MIRTHLVAALSFAFVAAASTLSAHALPHLGVHRHPAMQQADTRVSMYLYNKSASFRDLKIGERVYTVMPHATLAVKAPSGTSVVTQTTGNMHRKGDVLFALTPDMQSKTISID